MTRMGGEKFATRPLQGVTCAAILLLATGLLLAAPTVHSSFSTSTSTTGAFRTAATWGPANTVPPSITGPVALGGQLTGRDGEWSAAPSSFARRWLRCHETCTSVPGATGSTYILTAADVGHRIRFEVSAGTTTATSQPTSALAPTATTPGSISGDTPVGSTLTLTPATWTLHPVLPPTLNRTWWRCPGTAAFSPTTCSVSNFGSSTYKTNPVDVGHTLRVREHAIQNGVEGTVITNAFGPVGQPQLLSAVATTNAQSACPLSALTDNNTTTLWCSPETQPVVAGQWVRIDLGAVKTVSRVRIAYFAQTATYAAEGSPNGSTWQAVPAGGQALTPARQLRYVRLRATSGARCGCGGQVAEMSAEGF